MVVEVDGRRLRREQNREAVLDALVELWAEGSFEPEMATIAERAGISARSLFRYFDDLDDLRRAAIERSRWAASSLVDPDVDPGRPIEETIEAVVAARARLYEATAPAMRAARVCAHRSPIVAAQLHEGRTYFRRQLRRLFGDEQLPAIDSLCSFESYDLLRGEHRLSQARAEAVLVAALTALLIPDGGQP